MDEASRETSSGARSRAPVVLGLVAVLLAAAALVYAVTRPGPGPQESVPPAPPVVATPPPAATQLLDAGPAETDAGAQASAPQAEDAGSAVAPPTQGTLALTVEPPGRVEIDGRSVGRSPVRAAVEPGRRRVRLLDRDRGIDVTRSVTVASGGVTQESIFLQRGFVSVTAPPGATISIDGKQVGTAPLKEDLSLYEGSHVLEVQAGQAKFRESFTVRANQRVYFDVGPQYQ